MTAATSIQAPGVQLVHRGKVRDVYTVGDRLLLVASDRLSAFDHVLPTPVPGKGKVLTQLSLFWFNLTAGVVPNHVVTARVEEYPDVLQPFADALRGRSMLCKKAVRVDVECVVRGYLAGSGWKDYLATGSVFGHPMPKGLQQGHRFPTPIFTPTTKADAGHDEPIAAGHLQDHVGAALAAELEQKSLSVYAAARKHAEERGLLIADTKFEFGHVDGALILIDELLTPDSSRFWEAAEWRPGHVPDAYDKQAVRDHLERSGWDKASLPPALPASVVEDTLRRYHTAYRRLTGRDVP